MDEILDLKFRKITIMTADRKFVALDRWWGNKITTYKMLYEALEQFSTERDVDVARTYCTINEFFNAKELRSREEMRQNRNFLLSSYVVIESDYHLATGIHFYRELNRQLDRMGIQPIMVFSGNKSIHFYIKINRRDYLTPKQRRIHDGAKTLDLTKEFYLEQQARHNFLTYHLDLGKMDKLVDKKLKYDLLRQVSVPTTFNLQARKFVTPVDKYYLFSDPSEIIRKATIHPDRRDLHQQLDQRVKENLEHKLEQEQY